MDGFSEYGSDAMLATLFLSTTMCFLIASKLKNQKRNHRFWVRPIFRNRKKYGYYSTLLRELRSNDEEFFFDFLRVTPTIFDWLLSRVSPLIQKEDTFFRKCIPPNERLAVTLRFLATGESFRSLSFGFRLGRQTVRTIIPETCEALWNCFKEEFLPFPDSPEKWKAIAKEYEEKWQLPHCCGSIDGKHILRECPSNTGSLHHNYKGTFSSILMAVADANYKFIMIDYGHYGSESDGGIFRKTVLGQQILHHRTQLPTSEYLPNTETYFPYFFIGDEAFPLCYNLLRPYPKAQLSHDERIFNYRLSRARRVVENAFGILSARFRFLKRPLNFCDKTTENMVLAACVLHNILIEKSPAYCPTGMVDSEDENHALIAGDWRAAGENCLSDIHKVGSFMYSRQVKNVRNIMKQYLVSEGAVEWQERMISCM